MGCAVRRSFLMVCALSAVWSGWACSSSDAKAPVGDGAAGSGGGGSSGTGGTGSGGVSGTGGASAGTGGTSAGTGGGSGGAGTGGSVGTGGAAVDAGPSDTASPDAEVGGGAFAVTAPWKDGGAIDAMYACTMNRFPMISWTDGPAGTMSYAMIFFDTANSLVHTAMLNIPATVKSLPPVPAGVNVSSIGTVNNTTWAGPCPPAGQPHTYQLTIYALRTAMVTPGATAAATRTSLENAANADVLAKARVSGIGMR
jgi:phosphatidylethanolamine-binding protein (PEBP) family uncharacterized protein